MRNCLAPTVSGGRRMHHFGEGSFLTGAIRSGSSSIFSADSFSSTSARCLINSMSDSRDTLTVTLASSHVMPRGSGLLGKSVYWTAGISLALGSHTIEIDWILPVPFPGDVDSLVLIHLP